MESGDFFWNFVGIGIGIGIRLFDEVWNWSRNRNQTFPESCITGIKLRFYLTLLEILEDALYGLIVTSG